MHSKLLTAASILIGLASAKKCQKLTIPIEASARNGVFDLSPPATDIDVSNYILNLYQQGVNYSQNILTGYATVSGSYNIAATYCEPDSGPSSALQILTHGLGADQTYWDLSYNNYNYSYVNVAVDQYGFSTFTWDRLGIADSSHGNPVQEIQAPLENAALHILTKMLKHGKIEGLPKSFETIIVGGHSFGSQHTYALTSMYPKIADCMLLQGWSFNGSFPQDFAYGGDLVPTNYLAQLDKYNYPEGYFVNGGPGGIQIDFLAPGDFDPGMLRFLNKNRQPITPGEYLTAGFFATVVESPFAGPVHVVTGERDLVFCGGNCLAAPTGFNSIPGAAIKNFPKAEVFNVTIVPGAGHGLNFGYTHALAYTSMNDFLIENGCAPS